MTSLALGAMISFLGGGVIPFVLLALAVDWAGWSGPIIAWSIASACFWGLVYQHYETKKILRAQNGVAQEIKVGRSPGIATTQQIASVQGSIAKPLSEPRVVEPPSAPKIIEPPQQPEAIEDLFIFDVATNGYAALLTSGEAVGYFENRYRRYETLSHFRAKVRDFREWPRVTTSPDHMEAFRALVPDFSLIPRG